MGQYTNLNGEQVKKRVKELIAQYAEHGIQLHLDADYIYADRQNEVWYGGEIASFEYQKILTSVTACFLSINPPPM